MYSGRHQPWLEHKATLEYRAMADKYWPRMKLHVEKLPLWIADSAIHSWENNPEELIWNHVLGFSYTDGSQIIERALGNEFNIYSRLQEQISLLPGWGPRRSRRLLVTSHDIIRRWTRIVNLAKEQPDQLLSRRHRTTDLRDTIYAAFTRENIRVLREWVLSGQPDLRAR